MDRAGNRRGGIERGMCVCVYGIFLVTGVGGCTRRHGE